MTVPFIEHPSEVELSRNNPLAVAANKAIKDELVLRNWAKQQQRALQTLTKQAAQLGNELRAVISGT